MTNNERISYIKRLAETLMAGANELHEYKGYTDVAGYAHGAKTIEAALLLLQQEVPKLEFS
jgi:hypothetical protein